MGAVGGAGSCGGGIEGVLVVCGTTALMDMVVRVDGGSGCARGTCDGVVRCGASRGVGGLWGLAALGRVVDKLTLTSVQLPDDVIYVPVGRKKPIGKPGWGSMLVWWTGV